MVVGMPDGAPLLDRRRRPAVLVASLLAVALAALWPLQWANTQGDLSAVLGAGIDGPAAPVLQRELPEAIRFGSFGHDGQQFYVVARYPLDPKAGARFLDSPAYRYRRILYPALAGVLAPDGGRRLVVALLAVALAGVLLAALATGLLPGAPSWLPLVVGVTPGVGVACALTLSDALATGLAMAAVAAAVHRRWPLTVGLLVAAALTRETLLLVALGLAVAPGLSRVQRLSTVAVPAIVVGLWAAWSAAAMDGDMAGGAGQVTVPLLGWIQSESSVRGLVVGLGSTVVLILGAVHARRWGPEGRAVAAVIALHAA
jgi:hypothetical protein